ncbi:hypothetical protein [Hydrocarboniclastica marina]|uniref:Uncharacterized protein n=1 Tax=Hydrocarboniclastica marina TaxID=2259620 RepID=A0A4P7XCT7_9ALTE|nr:hypothetical protein [Hydrocarboniclastica marina]QCF24668.1 hypothetical protein soil367_01120 [Hydrocarboniclastica marina]
MINRPRTSKTSRVIRILLILLFVYGGISYSLSLMEYTWFQATGEPVFGASEHYEEFDENQLRQAFLECGTHLMGASGITTPEAGTLIYVRCGRFWPFYRYSLQVPAHPKIPGALITYEDEPDSISESRAELVKSVRLASFAWMGLALGVLGLSLTTLYHFAIRRDSEKAFKWGFQTFISSLLMMATYIGFSFWIDPLFRYGW